ncbi:unnamed protein product [Peronospora destructor]|uniref:Uncharacterized protein n=1 Tax=Peronospora destructor TaxID=86335 RepID=A0AAV0U1I0_9STRA|nr:unnamed protein product [Peronospora destructor]
MRVFVGAVTAMVLSGALCAGAPRAFIRVIPRPRQEKMDAPVLVPIPSRDPLPAFQGPFVDTMESMPCVQEEREIKPGKTYILDLCVLENVTVTAKMEEEVDEMEEVELDVSGSVSKRPDATEGGDDAIAKMKKDPTTEEKEEMETPLILGIFRGWHIDPITLAYKYMIYDDGDKCMDNDHYSIHVELVPSSNPESDTKLFGLKKSGMCMFTASLLTYVPKEDRVAGRGIHTPGVIDISDAETSLPVVCGKMKCRYEDISNRVRDLSNQIRDVRASIVARSSKASTLVTNMTLETSKNALESANQIVEKLLQLFHETEDLQRSLRSDFLERKEVAKEETAEENKEKREKHAADAIPAAG